MASITVPGNFVNVQLVFTWVINNTVALQKLLIEIMYIILKLYLPKSTQFFFFPNLSTMIPTNGVAIASTVWPVHKLSVGMYYIILYS